MTRIEINNLIDGELVAAASGATIETIEPASGCPWGTLPASGAADVDRAVDAAERAASAWCNASPADRCAVLCRLADLIDRDLERLAEIESTDNGKPVSLARAVDIPRSAINLRFFATRILHGSSEVHQTPAGGVLGARALNYTLRQPIGVVGCISPWNLPLYLFTWKIAPALAAGNTVVAKPSEVTPATAFELSRLAIEAGMPPGVLNIVHGLGPDAGQAIVEHPRIKAVSFTGGTATGQRIAATAAPMFKKLSLELGGKNPTIVFADADFDEAISTSVRAGFANQGQICLCGSRIYVERAIVDRFVEHYVDRAGALRVGDPRDTTTQVGAVVSESHRDKIEAAIAVATDEGGVIRTGGKRPKGLPSRCEGGYFVEPTVITGLGIDCRTNQEEIFGPVVTIAPFDTEDEAIALANGTSYGLSASVWTTNLTRAHRVAERIDAGTVWINCWLIRDLRVPFGGVKDSGVGREGGDEALRFFTEPKNVCLKLE